MIGQMTKGDLIKMDELDKLDQAWNEYFQLDQEDTDGDTDDKLDQYEDDDEETIED